MNISYILLYQFKPEVYDWNSYNPVGVFVCSIGLVTKYSVTAVYAVRWAHKTCLWGDPGAGKVPWETT